MYKFRRKKNTKKISKEKVSKDLFNTASVHTTHIEVEDMHIDADYSCTFRERMN